MYKSRTKKSVAQQVAPVVKTISKNIDVPINFLDKKYQKGGYSLPDNPTLYPSYSYVDKKIGAFTVNYIGKTLQIQNYWSIKNKSGYFSKYTSPEDGAHDSNNIQKIVDQNNGDYYIVTSLLPSRYINTNYSHDEFDISNDAFTSFYLFENGRWELLDSVVTHQLPSNIFLLYIQLIQNRKCEKNISKKFWGRYSVHVETEGTTTGMASIAYDLKITADKIVLETNTYHEPIRCNGVYKANESNNFIELYYAEEDESCISIEPLYLIKEERGNYYIQGIGAEQTIKKWVLLKKNE